jgi:hypothetical protein
MGRRILNRKDLRADYDAAERRSTDEEEVEEEGEEEEEDEEEAEGDGEEGGEEAAAAGDEDDEEAPPPKKKKKVAAPKEAKPKRSRAAKVVRMKVSWGVFNNSHQCVAKFEYKEKQQAHDHAAKLAAAKNPPQTFFVQPVKEPMEAPAAK